MKKLLLAFALLPSAASAYEIKLDESWGAKLNQLCIAASYGSKMTAEPICAELNQIFIKAGQDDAARQAREKEEKK